MGLFDTAVVVNSTGTAVIAAANGACILWASSQRGSGQCCKHASGSKVLLQPAHKNSVRLMLRAITALNVLSPVAWLVFAMATLAYREEMQSTLISTQPLLAAALALLVVFNFSALVMFITNMRAFCGSRGGLIFDSDLTRELLPTRSLPPVHPSDSGKARPQAAFLAFLHRIDAMLQAVLFSSSRRPGPRRRPESPFAKVSFAATHRQPARGHTRHASYDEENPLPAQQQSRADSLHRAATAPEGSMHRFLDRDFMATVQMQSRLTPHMSMDSLPPSPEPAADAQMLADILAHRPEPTTGAAGSLGPECALEDWGHSLAVSVPPAALSPVKPGLEGLISVHVSACSQQQPAAAPVCTARSVEKELESLLGHAVKGVLLGEQ